MSYTNDTKPSGSYTNDSKGYGTNPGDSNLYGFYKLTEGSGTTAYDYSSNDRDATISGATFIADDETGYSLSFDGVDDYVSVADDHIVVTQSPSLSSQDSGPVGVSFKTDGTKMYMMGNTTDDVFQYTLSTAWDPSTAVYDTVSFSCTGQDSSPTGFYVKPDGTKFYIVGFTNKKVFQYSMTAWDLSTAAYETKEFAIAEDTTPRGITFNPTGSIMYIIGDTNNKIFQYALGTPWDITTASYGGLFINTPSSGPTGLTFNSDGTVLFVSDDTGNAIYRMALSVAYDITSAVWATGDQYLNVFGEDTTTEGLYLKSDGLQLFMAGLTNKKVYRYTLTAVDNFYINDLQSGFSMSAWIKPGASGENSYRIWDKSNGSTVARYGFDWYLSTDGTLGAQIAAGTARTSATGAITMDDSTWYHVVVTVGSDTTITHYINGSVSGTPGTTGALNKIVTRNSYIGNRRTATDRTFDGSIKYLKFYKKTLSQDEVSWLYNSYKGFTLTSNSWTNDSK